MEYDYVIVGAGISGLLCAIKIAKKFPNAKIAVTEMYPNAGGRIQTYNKDGIHWEKGAGRIHSSHTHVNELVKHYGLTKIEIPNNTQWLSEGHSPEKNLWPTIARIIVDSFSKFEQSELQLHTLEQLMDKVLQGQLIRRMLSKFAYTSEVTSLRADLALQSLNKELGDGTGHFYVLAEGLQAITDNMKEDAIKLGVTFLYKYRLVSIGKADAYTSLNYTVDKKLKLQLKAKKVILAIHSEGLKGISLLKNLPILKKITMKPLLRIYSVFPTPAWFESIPRTITDSPLRHIIPISTKTGAIMSSYTDSDDTRFWMNIYNNYGEKAVLKKIIKESEILFQKKIPEPHIFKLYYWKEGCSYWLPGLYNVHDYSRKIMRPIPLVNANIYICGESYAVNQAWVESALSHTTEMLETYILNT
jgi:monoamine oxidase